MPVYLVRSGDDGLVKIGFSDNVNTRLAKMQTDHPAKLSILRILDGGMELEAALHARFAMQRQRGEWFIYSDEMLSDLGAPELVLEKTKHQSAGERKPWSVDARAAASGRRLALHANPGWHAALISKIQETNVRKLQVKYISQVANRAGGWGRLAEAIGVPLSEIMTWQTIPIRHAEAVAAASKLPVTKLAALVERAA